MMTTCYQVACLFVYVNKKNHEFLGFIIYYIYRFSGNFDIPMNFSENNLLMARETMLSLNVLSHLLPKLVIEYGFSYNREISLRLDVDSNFITNENLLKL